MKAFITGIFHNRVAAHAAVEALTAQGFLQNEISVLMSQETRGREFGIKEETKAPEGAVTGAVAGGVLGAIVLALVAAGSIVIPGGILVAGPIAAALAGLGVGGAAGGIVGALIGAGVPEHEAKLLNERLRAGGILVGVHAEGERASVAKQILKDTGGDSIKRETVRA